MWDEVALPGCVLKYLGLKPRSLLSNGSENSACEWVCVSEQRREGEGERVGRGRGGYAKKADSSW